MPIISSVTFETAALADAIKKAAKVAPNRGAAFDKAAGVVIEFDPASPLPVAIIRATNLEISTMEWVNVASMEGEHAVWRLPSGLLGHVVGLLPIGTGKQVQFYSEPTGERQTVIHMKSGRTKVKFNPLDMTYYPLWGAFDPDNMFPADELGGRIDQVEWACSRSDVNLSGVRLDGEYAVATDRFRVARVPLSIPDLPEPIVVPSGILAGLLKARGDVHIGSDGHQLNIMPDEHTQLKAVLMDVKYPNLQGVFDREFDSYIELSRDALLAIMTRVNGFGEGDRNAGFRIFIGKGEIAVYMRNEGAGDIGDVLECPGYADHDRFEIKFTPKNIMEPLSKSPNDKIKLYYNAGVTKGALKVDDGAGYEVWAMSRSSAGEQS